VPQSTPRLILIALALVVLAAVALPSTGAPVARALHQGDVTSTDDAFAWKIHPALRASASVAAASAVFDVVVYAQAGADLSPYLSNILTARYVWPNGTQTYYGLLRAANLSKLASLPAVAAIQDLRFAGERPRAPDLGERRLNAYDPATARARVAALKAERGSGPPATSGPAGPADWFDVLDVHQSRAAWELGYTGRGVKALVNDTGVDFAHPDLANTYARVEDPASPYYGWPVMFDAFSMLNLAFDRLQGTEYIKSGTGLFGYAPDYADTSETRSGAQVELRNDGTATALFAPINSLDPFGYTYRFPATSKSGVYHFGSHPDTTFEAFFNERVAVLVVDEHTAGVYDTVYVDLDADLDFTNNKKATKGDEIVSMDLDEDGYADLSGGLVYWIADGRHPLPASDWRYGLGADIAGPGGLVAFAINDFAESGDHGTLCASGIAAQGVIDGGAPAFKPAGNGEPFTGQVQGGGRDVKLSANGDGYATSNALDEGMLFAALGYDGIAQTADDMQIISNSWGNADTVNDGWDYTSRLFDFILRYVNPYLVEGNSTGNGGAGYGTTNSPSANLSISVGASTLYDSSGYSFDSIASRDQFLYGDSMSFSDRGPTSQGEIGVSVLANGAWGAGNVPLNEAFAAGADGWNAWESWGGTSRSTPVALGNLALAMQAFREKQGRWPTNVEARSILMAGADTAWNDGFVEGAGVVNALRSAQIAAGLSGISVLPDSVTFGAYRGAKYDAFSSIMFAGESRTETFTVTNAGASPAQLTLSDDHLVRFAEKTIDFTTADQKGESANFYFPDYLIDIAPHIPAGAQMVEIILVQPFDEFDPDGDYNANSSWRIVPTGWTDVNRDGKLFEDKDGNGAINCPTQAGLPHYEAAACEIQAGEYMRFGYGYDRGTTSQQRVKLPLERMGDGIFAGLSHRAKSALVPVSHLKIQLNFYRAEDMPWLSAPGALTVPAGGSATFDAVMTLPADAALGLHQATIRISDGTHVTNVPVAANVAANGTDFALGTGEGKTPYENGRVSGYFDWTGRAESGDWRFFFLDAPDATPPGTYLLVDNGWDGARTDIDTIIMSPAADCFSNGVGCGHPVTARFPGAPDAYGPYTLAPSGGSDRLNPRAGLWLRQTSTGGPREIVAGTIKPGLNLVALHNVSLEGDNWAEPFGGQAGAIRAAPNPVDLYVGGATFGVIPVTVESSLALADLEVGAFGLGVPQVLSLPQIQDDPDDPASSSHTFAITAQNAALIEATTSAAEGDLDLFLVYDRNSDGYFDFLDEVVASSTTATANESIRITFPPDGEYLLAVHGWGAQEGEGFTLNLNVIAGDDLQAVDLPSGPHEPNTPIGFKVTWALDAPLAGGAEALGLILLGPPGAESAVEIPVRLHNALASLESLSLIAADDARLFSGIPDYRYGAHRHLHVGANDTSRAALRFDLSSLPARAQIARATLRLYVEAFGGGGSPADLAAYRLASDWSESTVTWNAPWRAKGGDLREPPTTARISKADVGKFVELDMTGWAQEWAADPASNHGLLLRLVNQTSFTYYRLPSGEYWAPAEAPALVVTYIEP
jgi:hypothetical protein